MYYPVEIGVVVPVKADLFTEADPLELNPHGGRSAVAWIHLITYPRLGYWSIVTQMIEMPAL